MGGEKKELTLEQCRRCSQTFHYVNSDTFWDEGGSGYSTKLVRCPICGALNVIRYEEDYGLNINYDPRFYN